MPGLDIDKFFAETYAKEKSSAIATLKTLIQFLNQDDFSTAIEMSKNVRVAINRLKELDCRTEVESVAEIYFRFITLSSGQFEQNDVKAFRQELAKRSEVYLNKVMNSRKDLARHGKKFIADGCKILVHSMSRAVLHTLLEAKSMNRSFTVYVTESAPDYLGKKMHKSLTEEGINATLILDSAMGYIMERVDFVLVGAEGVVESGGIINKIGTYPIAICAKAYNKPFYVLAESYKFIRLFPLSQAEIPDRLKWRNQPTSGAAANTESHPLVDYTPPSYINLLFTDLGILTTAAVCETLLQIYT